MENKERMLEETELELAEQEWNEVVSQEMAGYLQQENGESIGENPVEQEKPRFVIDSDAKADWAVRKIEEEKQEYDRIKELAEEQIARIEQKLEAADRRFCQSTAYLRSLLGEYFMQVPHKRTKTQETYRLLSVKLVMKLPKAKTVYDEAELIEFLKANGYNDYIKKEEKAWWGEFKKLLDLSSGQVAVLKDTGEMVECIRITETPAEFKVEV